MTEDNILKRLSILKLLYKIGVEQSYKGEMTSYFSILSFHDSIEMFLKLTAEKLDKRDCQNFMQYWEMLDKLTLKEAMRKLNANRVNLKHKGIIPSKFEIETSRVNTALFFEENVPKYFDLNFSEINLFELIKYEHTKAHLKQAEFELKNIKFKECIHNCVRAFNELLLEYKSSKRSKYSFTTPFDLIKNVSFDNSRSWGNENKTPIDKTLKETFKTVNENFKKIENALQLVSLGIDYKKYIKFSLLSPQFYKTSNGDYNFYGDEREWSEKECEFCIDFILDSSLILQDFDFNFSELSKKK